MIEAPATHPVQSPVEIQGEDLLTNGGFGFGLQGWNVGSPTVLASLNGCVASIDRNGGGFIPILYTDALTTVSGATYALEVLVTEVSHTLQINRTGATIGRITTVGRHRFTWSETLTSRILRFYISGSGTGTASFTNVRYVRVS